MERRDRVLAAACVAALAAALLAGVGEAQVHDGAWRPIAEIRGDGTSMGMDGRLAMDADTLILGSPADDGLWVGAGAVYVFHRDETGAWRQTQRLLGDDPMEDMGFGHTVNMYGYRLFVGAWGNVEGKSGSVHYYSYDSASGAFDRLVRLAPPEGTFQPRYGHSVAWVDGLGLTGWPPEAGVLAVGAMEVQGLGPEPVPGEVFVYETQASLGQYPLAHRIADPGQPYSAFGAHVVMTRVGDLLVGAPGTRGGGAIHHFRYDGSQWDLKQTLRPPTNGTAGSIGWSFAYWGNTLAAAQNNDPDHRAGAVHLWKKTIQGFVPVGTIAAPDPDAQFAADVGLRSNLLAVGAPGWDDAQGFTGGGVHIYESSPGSHYNTTSADQWVHQAYVEIPAFDGADASFGDRVAVSAGRVAVGTLSVGDPVNDWAYIIERDACGENATGCTMPTPAGTHAPTPTPAPTAPVPPPRGPTDVPANASIPLPASRMVVSVEPDVPAVAEPHPAVRLTYEADEAMQVTQTVHMTPTPPIGLPPVADVDRIGRPQYVDIRVESITSTSQRPAAGNATPPAPERVTLELEYDEGALTGAAEEDLALHFFDGEAWVDLRSIEPGTIIEASTPEGPLTVYGAGVDTEHDTVWAVVDHTSSYALGIHASSSPEGAGSPVWTQWWAWALMLAAAAIGVWGTNAILLTRRALATRSDEHLHVEEGPGVSIALGRQRKRDHDAGAATAPPARPRPDQPER